VSRLFAVAVVLIAVGAVNEWRRFPDDFDFITYHLPAALGHIGRTTFTPDRFLANEIAGHPPLPHLAMAALIAIGARISTAALLGTVSFAIYLAGMRWLGATISQLHWMALAALAVPLVPLQLFRGFVDLWVGAWMAVACVAALEADRRGLNRRSVLTFGVALAVTAWSKQTAWPLVGAAWLWCAVRWNRPAVDVQPRARREARMVLAVVALLVIAWPVRNLIVLGNPTCTWKPPLIAGFLRHPCDLAPVKDETGMVLHDAPAPVRFFASIFEVGRLRAPYLRYTADMYDDFEGQHSNHRMGGWGLWTVLFVCAWWVHWYRRRDGSAGPATSMFVLLLVVASLLPSSYQLRFWLFIPLGLLACLVKYDIEFAQTRMRLFLACLALTIGHVAYQVSVPGRASMDDLVTPQIREFWRTARLGVNYVVPQDYHSIFWAGPDLNTFTVRAQ
jgi:hypothetical protein